MTKADASIEVPSMQLSPVQGDVILYEGKVYEVPFNWLTTQIRTEEANKKLNKALDHRPVVQVNGAFSCKRCDYHPHGQKVEYSMTGLHMAKGEPVADIASCHYGRKDIKIAHPLFEESTSLVAMVQLPLCHIDHNLIEVLAQQGKMEQYLKNSLAFDFPTVPEFLDMISKCKNLAKYLIQPSKLPPNFVGDRTKEIYLAMVTYFCNVK